MAAHEVKDGILGKKDDLAMKANEFMTTHEITFGWIVCILALIVGVLLFYNGKKFLRVIVCLLSGLCAAIGVFVIFTMAEERGHEVEHKWIIYVICTLCGLIASAASFKWAINKIAEGIICGLAFWYLCMMGLASISFKNHDVMSKVTSIVGGVAFGLAAIKWNKGFMKFTGAVFGSFLVCLNV